MSSTIKQAIEALKSRVADAYTAIVAKGGTLPATQDSANLPSAIASIPSGGGEEGGGIYHDKYPINDIIFTDHTGSIFYSCSIAEAQQMTEMPEAPAYDKLIFDTYTHTLTQIQDGMPHVIGAVYKTIMDTKYGVADILYMKVVALPLSSNNVTITFPSASKNYYTEIDWGDGTIEMAHSSDNTHTYSEIGEYDVILRRTNTRTTIDNTVCYQARKIYGSSWSNPMPNSSTKHDDMLEEIMIPAIVFPTSSNYYLYGCASIKAIILKSLQQSILSIGINAARFIVVPNTPSQIFNPNSAQAPIQANLAAVEAISVSGCNMYGKVQWISIQSGTTLPNYFLRANNTKKAWLPSTITSFPSEVFGWNGNTIVELHIAAATPPTLPNSNSPYLASGAKIYVPSGSKSAYEASTNWAAVASRYSATFVEE